MDFFEASTFATEAVEVGTVFSLILNRGPLFTFSLPGLFIKLTGLTELGVILEDVNGVTLLPTDGVVFFIVIGCYEMKSIKSKKCILNFEN